MEAAVTGTTTSPFRSVIIRDLSKNARPMVVVCSKDHRTQAVEAAQVMLVQAPPQRFPDDEGLCEDLIGGIHEIHLEGCRFVYGRDFDGIGRQNESWPRLVTWILLISIAVKPY